MELRLARIIEESAEVRTLIFEGEIPAYKPGCFFRMWLPDANGKKSFRPYSAASHPSEAELRFCIKRNGGFSSRVWGLREGEEVMLDGPHGNFSLDANDPERVFLAGGVGITPLRSMLLQTLLEGRRCSLFHSSQSLSSMPCIGEMKLLALRNRFFSYYPAITREQPPEGWDGLRGRLTAGTIERKLGSLEDKAFYLCGPPEMVSGIAKGLLGAGVEKESIKKEEWG
jgi:Na+-transporting NADH:ubiquinone oxidoreductase subunit F